MRTVKGLLDRELAIGPTHRRLCGAFLERVRVLRAEIDAPTHPSPHAPS